MSTEPPGRQHTREHLLQTAERLIAQSGVSAVSLRQIVSTAGHRNPAAVQYHFGSKEKLVQAIIEHRLPPLNARRLELLRELELSGREDDVAGIMQAVVLPLVELESSAPFYVSFLARLSGDPAGMNRAFDAVDERAGQSGRLVHQSLERAMAELPPPIRDHRIQMAMHLVLTNLATRQQRFENDDDDGLTREEFVQDLIDATAGLLSAPRRSAVRPAAGPREGTGPRRRPG
jgi:AcrR family transcriptional regulator